ncbi:MAG: hypothetical protein U0074_02690 [Kouleothrix sp.]
MLPTYLRQGIGNALYTRLLGDLINQVMAAMLSVDDTLADLHPALARRGFRELLHSWAFTLDPRTCDPARFSTAHQKLARSPSLRAAGRRDCARS